MRRVAFVSTLILSSGSFYRTSIVLKRLRPISPWGFFNKIRISAGGALIEDFDYARTHEMFHMMKPKEIRENDQVEGFEFSIDDTLGDGNYAGIVGGCGKKTV